MLPDNPDLSIMSQLLSVNSEPQTTDAGTWSDKGGEEIEVKTYECLQVPC